MNKEEYEIYKYDHQMSQEENNLVQKLFDEFIISSDITGINQRHINFARAAWQDAWIHANLYRAKMILG